jgi:hypothetical protein
VEWGLAPKNEDKLSVVHDEYANVGTRLLGEITRGVLGSSQEVHVQGARIAVLERLPLTVIEDWDGDSLRPADGDGFPDEGYAVLSRDASPFTGEIVGWTGRRGDVFTGCELLRDRFGSTRGNFLVGDLVQCLPFRHWDRYVGEHDGSELAYFQASYAAPGSRWDSISWEEGGWQGGRATESIRLRVLCRFDGTPAWSERPTNRPGGLWEFTAEGEHPLRSTAGAPVVADSIEVRVYWEFEKGAWADGSNDWKRTLRLKNLTVTFGNPLVVRKVDLLDY